MARKQMAWKTRGMNRDLSVSAFNPEFAFENRNLRLGTNDSNTLMSWVTEKGTARIEIVRGNWIKDDPTTRTNVDELIGTPIGTAVINHQLVVFTTDAPHSLDYIYVLKYADDAKTQMLAKMLFGGDDMSLGFDVEHPIETLVSYEAEDIQKVYWTDGINQPRVINIEGNIRKNNNTQFDFVPTLQLQETVKIKKLLGANGMFAPGVIQYAFTYYTKFGQESNIFYTSPLLYISYRDRGASPEDKVENAFQIIVENIDTKFDYLRIYSIQRTSINATPICKRVQDIDIRNLGSESSDYRAIYIDTGTNGDSIDPTELLYKGGENITVQTLAQKDETLFMGNLSIKRNMLGTSLKNLIKNHYTLDSTHTRQFKPLQISSSTYAYANQLTSEGLTVRHQERTVPCGGFKTGDYYRCGIQFQYNSGKWSEPVFLNDKQIEAKPVAGTDTVDVPIITGTLTSEAVVPLIEAGYVNARAVVVFPDIQDREALCQGVVCPTIYPKNEDNKYQSSWFFRPKSTTEDTEEVGTTTVFPKSKGNLEYTSRQVADNDPGSGTVFDPKNIRRVEIQGHFNSTNYLMINRTMRTFHSPDVEFDEQLQLVDFVDVQSMVVGKVEFISTMSDIDIQTESPTISTKGSGFVHKDFYANGPNGIVSGLFYDDGFVDDNVDVGDDESGGSFGVWPKAKSAAKWLIYPWQGTGSLNNDINRPSNKGVPSAVLKKKVISNLRYATTDLMDWSDRLNTVLDCTELPQMFSSNENEILKLSNNRIYRGNIDTILMPDEVDGTYFCFDGWGSDRKLTVEKSTDFQSINWCKTWNAELTSTTNYPSLHKWNKTRRVWEAWDYGSKELGETYRDLVVKKLGVRIKYKSTKHLLLQTAGLENYENHKQLAVLEIRRKDNEERRNTRYGGQSEDALRANIWLPCGDPVSLHNTDDNGIVTFYYDYGDTYYQRYDCLKTYPFTREDFNQVVEIGSFMLESRVNIDGRYDRNRGQINNLNMSPINFNLLNPVYTQLDNFFQYRIMDSTLLESNKYPNQITWSKTKTSGADTDLWTNVTLASVLEMDGDKGEVRSLQKLNNQLICFQDRGIAHILYNENAMIQTTNNVPVELANSGKVQGKDYKSNTVGCSNKWTIQTGARGIYFMDADGKDIFCFNGQLNNVSLNKGFNAWSKLHIPSGDIQWTPTFPDKENRTAFITFYDRMNQEMLFINRSYCLAYSEKYDVFTSFYDYNGTPFYENLDDTGVWLRANQLWKHNAGNYCNFFGAPRPYSMVLVGNPEPLLDKIFTNLEFRASVDAEGDYKYGTYRHYLPFDSLDTWNEYQHGIAYLNNMRGHDAMIHHTSDNEASLKRKFRIWRCDIPRDNGDNLDTFDETFDDTFHPLARDKKHPLDRMRNPWLYLRLRNSPDGDLSRTEIHDVVMTYFA